MDSGSTGGSIDLWRSIRRSAWKDRSRRPLRNWAEIRRSIWNYVGIVRTDQRLQRALDRAQLLARKIEDSEENYPITTHFIELRNLVVVAELIIRCALKCGVYRGPHFTLDHPDLLKHPDDTILTPGKEP